MTLPLHIVDHGVKRFPVIAIWDPAECGKKKKNGTGKISHYLLARINSKRDV